MYRLTEQVYFDSAFAIIVLMTAMNTQCRLKSIRDSLVSRYESNGHPCTCLVSKRTDCYQEAIRYVMDLPSVSDFRRRLMNVCTAHGEWSVIKHDGAYKCAKSLIGAAGTTTGEDLFVGKTAHTIVGKIGSSPRSAIKHGEDRSSCFEAIGDILLDAEIRSRFSPPRMTYRAPPSQYQTRGRILLRPHHL